MLACISLAFKIIPTDPISIASLKQNLRHKRAETSESRDMIEAMNHCEKQSSNSARTGLSKPRWVLALLAITVLALFLRINFVLNAVIDHPIRGDAAQYFAAAWNLVHHHTLSIVQPGSPTISGDSFRDPGYPILLAFWLCIFGDTGPWYAATLITQALLGALCIPLLLSALRSWPSDRWLIGAGLLMAIWPHSVTVTSYLLTETLFSFLCSLSLLLLSVGMRRKDYRWIIASGLSFGAAGLTNATLIPFAPLLAIAMTLLRCIDRKLALALAVSGLLLPLTWQLRNLHLSPGSQTSSQRALINLVQGSWPEYHSSWRASMLGDPLAKQVQQRIANEYTVLQAHPALGAKLISERLASAPWRYFWWYLSKPARFWGWSIQIGQGDIYIYPTYHSPFNYNPVLVALLAVCHMLNPILALAATLGCFLSLLQRKSSPGIVIAMAFMAIYATVIYSILQAEPRYAIAFRGIELSLAAGGFWYLAQGLRNFRRPVSESWPSTEKHL
jgi:hypothetical protein